MIRWQAYLLPLALLFEALSLRWDSAVFLAQSKRVPVRWVEITLFALHHVMHLGAFLVAFGSREGLAVYACKEAALGTYLGLMFLPNHIGCPVLDGTRRIGRLRRQVETARNLLPHLAARVVFGPLVHQIEHHAFPSVPLPRLPRVRELLRPCCDEAGIAYREMGMGAAYREVFAGLQRVAKTGTSSARAAPTR